MNSKRVVFDIWNKYPVYRNIQYSLIVTSFSTWGTFIAMLVLLHRITNNGLELGILWSVSGLAPLLFSLLVGAWIDRIDVRKSMIVNEILKAVLYLVFLLVPHLHGWIAWGLFLALRFVIGILSQMTTTARQTVIPQLVKKDDLVVANSLNFSITSVIRLLGASFGGILVTYAGIETAWILSVVSFLISALLIMKSKWDSNPSIRVSKKFSSEIKEGLSVARKNKWIRSMLLTSLSIGIIIGTFNLMIEEYVSSIYKIPDYGISLLYVSEGTVSALLGYWIANRKFMLKNKSYYGYLYVIVGVSWVVFGFSNNLLEGCMAMVFFAAANALIGPFERQVMQVEVPRT